MKNIRIELVEIDEVHTLEVMKADIIEDVRLELYGENEATLIIGDEFEIDFTWTETAAAVFGNLTAEQVALLGVLTK
ncbi:hypothetical protein [Solibacillus sp. FSL K6-1126]|uniref:hypothetical protein n=1 Tax=Solibacillus sp. FSL K6-1126 TaxID=2921463 RepID=UPI0030F613D4